MAALPRPESTLNGSFPCAFGKKGTVHYSARSTRAGRPRRSGRWRCPAGRALRAAPRPSSARRTAPPPLPRQRPRPPDRTEQRPGADPARVHPGPHQPYGVAVYREADLEKGDSPLLCAEKGDSPLFRAGRQRLDHLGGSCSAAKATRAKTTRVVSWSSLLGCFRIREVRWFSLVSFAVLSSQSLLSSEARTDSLASPSPINRGQ